MMVDPSGFAPKWWQTVLVATAVIVVAAAVATLVVVSCGATAAPSAILMTSIISGLKIAATAGVVAGTIRAGDSVVNSIKNGDSFKEGLVDAGKSFVTGFADGYLAGSMYAGGSMLLSSVSFGLSGKFNNGYGWQNGKWVGGYQTPNTPGISVGTYKGGINGGRSFGFDLDMYNGFHLHTNKLGFSTKNHIWWLAPIGIGIGVGLSDPYSEW